MRHKLLSAIEQATAHGHNRLGPLTLAVIGLLALIRLRLASEPGLSVSIEIIGELLIQGSAFLVVGARASRSANPHAAMPRAAHRDVANRSAAAYGSVLLVAGSLPWLVEGIMRSAGQGTGLELIMLSSFGWTTLTGAILSTQQRSLSLTVICSGFLTLLVTCSSDHNVALTFAYAWGALCLWWLASSHWQRVANCQVNTVKENRASRPLAVGLGCVVFAIAAWSMAGRFPPSSQLQWEVMPTSGGTSVNDPYASGGVGDGDAVVAAREHAASFGAVDSDVFLDSEESSLFDLYSDTFGEPLRKNKIERTIALAPQQDEPAANDKMSQSDQASSKLTTQRRGAAPSKMMKPKVSDALLFWIGRSNMHLPMQRYHDFDGIAWSPSQIEGNQPTQLASTTKAQEIAAVVVKQKTWFSPSSQDVLSARGAFVGMEAEAIKYARLRSASIPTPAGMHSWHIDKVDDPAMFALDSHNNLVMPGRERVPEFTIVRYVNRQFSLEHIDSVSDNHAPLIATALNQTSPSKSQQWIDEFIDDSRHDLDRRSNWQRIQFVVAHLRNHFRFDRTRDFSDSDDPVADFLISKSGSDLMFATTAASILKRLGIETRLVTGFVTRPEHRLGWSHETAIYADDMHAWLEAAVAPGSWVPLEPTPGFPQPTYFVSWRYWLKLHAWSIAGCVVGLVAVAYYAYKLRGHLLDLVCWLLGWCISLCNDRQRCRVVLRLLDLRARLVGKPRPEHVSPRSWYMPMFKSAPESIRSSLDQLFTEADRIWFGQSSRLSDSGRRACTVLWYRSTCKQLRQSST